MFNDDKSFLENKYHKTNEDFNPFSRMAYHGYDFDKSTGLEDAEIRDGLNTLKRCLKNLPHPVFKARAIEYVLKNTKIDISEHDIFVGIWSLNRLANTITQDVWKSEVFDNIIPEVQKTMQDLNDSGAVSIWPDFDHVVPDWNSILTLGFSGMLDRAEKYRDIHRQNGTLNSETEAFFDGMIIELNAVINLIDRLYNHADMKKMQKIAECLKNIRDNAPSNTYEAMQVIYIYFIVSECFDSYQVRSLGNGLDNSLYSFYRKDIDSGRYSEEEIREFFKYFLFQWAAIGNFWGQPFYMGGTNTDGTSKYTELSYIILDVYDELEIYNPKIQLKINRNTPDKILTKALDMIRRGHSSIAFCCEPAIIKAVMSYGATYDEAVNMDIRGCYETGVRANEVSTGTGYINALKPVLYALTNGFDKTLQKQIGIKTGKIEQFNTFDGFYHAVLKQWGHLIDKTIEVANQYEKFLSYINPSNLYSATIEHALIKGEDAYQSGVKFNNSAILNCGFASLVDSVMAVREFVYEKKAVTLKTMRAALENNWVGYEDLRNKILKSPHKYGNNDDITDIYTHGLSAYFANKVNNRPNARGGVYKAIMHSAMQFVWQGKKTSATPCGRYDGTEISKNASPAPGMDKNGVTALLNSSICSNPQLYPESHCIDIMLHPSATDGKDGIIIMKSLLFTYMENGGQSLQFNVFNADTLKAAQKNPEKYKNLQVRVCGWNVLWNNLSKAEQDAYITRAENII